MFRVESCRGRLIDFSYDHIVKEGRYGYLVYSVSDHHNTSVSYFYTAETKIPKRRPMHGLGEKGKSSFEVLYGG